jgi:hypothetical protein
MSLAIRFNDAQIGMLMAAAQLLEARLQFRAGPLHDDLLKEAINGALKGLHCAPAAA